MNFIIAENSEGKINFFDIENYSKLNKDSESENILISRLDIDIQVITIPHVPENELENVIKYRLRSIYPGNPDDTVYDYKFTKNKKNISITLFILNKSIHSKIEEIIGEKKLFVPCQLLSSFIEKKDKVIFYFYTKKWIDVSIFENKILISSKAFRNSGKNKYEKLVKFLSESDDTFKKAVVMNDSEIRSFAKENELNNNIIFYNYSEIFNRKCDIENSIFAKKQQSYSFIKKNKIPIYIFTLLILLLSIFIRNTINTINYYNKLKNTLYSFEKNNSSSLTIYNEIISLEEQIKNLKNSEPVNVYLFLSNIYKILGKDVKINSISLIENKFQLDIEGNNPFKIMDNFNHNPKFSKVSPQQITPIPNTNKDRFTVSGDYND